MLNKQKFNELLTRVENDYTKEPTKLPKLGDKDFLNNHNLQSIISNNALEIKMNTKIGSTIIDLDCMDSIPVHVPISQIYLLQQWIIDVMVRSLLTYKSKDSNEQTDTNK